MGLSYSPPQIPFTAPRGIQHSLNMSGESSMFSQSPETFLYGGPQVPVGHQSLSGTFSRASPQPLEQVVLSSSTNGTHIETLNTQKAYMMSGNIPSSQPQGSKLSPGGQP